jgi:hypothetical protein
MKFLKQNSQVDEGNSFLDIILCLCVILILALAVSSIKKEDKESTQSVQTNRFSGRGGQPKFKMVLHYDPNDIGFVIKVGKLTILYEDFRRIISHINRQESDGNPSFLFSASLTDGYVDAKTEDVCSDLGISLEDGEKARREDPNWWIVNLHKKRFSKLESECVEFKLKYTADHVGNWDGEKIAKKSYSSYDERRKKGKPFIWFTVDSTSKRIVFGPSNNQTKCKPEEFVGLISNISGNDGFYLEYRDSKTLKYDENVEIPQWVLEGVINPLGYGSYAAIDGV